MNWKDQEKKNANESVERNGGKCRKNQNDVKSGNSTTKEGQSK